MNGLARKTSARPAPRVGDQLARLAQPAPSLGAHLAMVLATQCRLAGAATGALLRLAAKGGQPRILCVNPAIPPGNPPPLWLLQAIQHAGEATKTGRTMTIALDDAVAAAAGLSPCSHLLIVPVKGGIAGTARAGRDVAAYIMETQTPAEIEYVRTQVEIASGLFYLHGMQIRLRGRESTIDGLRTAMEVLEVVFSHEQFSSAAMSLCNEIAARWGAERVTLGFLDGRYMKTEAISHTERFDRKMRLVRDLESVMEECLDQDTEVIHPRPQTSIYVSRAAETHSLQHGPVSIATLPLRWKGDAVGVLMLERRLDAPVDPTDVETLRLTCELVTGRLLDMRRRDRWIGAKAADAARDAVAVVLGPRHTGAKMVAVAVLVALVVLFVGRGTDRIDASFEIAAIERRVVPAPFEGRLREVHVDPGDAVVAGETVLARLETAELEMRLASFRAEYASYLKEADLAMRDRRTVDVQIAEANLARVDADLRLIEHRIKQATVVAPIGGTVVTGDLRRAIGAPVETGDVLFEIGQLGALEADVTVPEDRIADLLDGDGTETTRRGELATVSHPGDYIPFRVEHINPVAELVDQRNVFRVRVRLLETRPWLRPGMKGVAKITGPQRSYADLLTRRIVTWLRMKLWI